MKTYHEIYPIEGWADKISKHLEAIAADKPNMYAKTKQRYEKLADSLLDSVAKIALILEEDSLVSKSNNEFDELSDNSSLSISDKLKQVNARFHQLENFSKDNVGTLNHIPGGVQHKETIDYFDMILREASVHNFGYSEVNECAKMLYQWFHTRFRPDFIDVDFKYNIHYIPTWICDFIILYGKYHHANQNKLFVKMIDKWCVEVTTGSKGNYAIPYEVYNLEKEFNPSDYTIDAVVINDILSSQYLYKLFEDEFQGVIHYDYNVLISVVKDRNPSLHSKVITRIAKRKELIKEIGLTPVGGSIINE